MLVIVIGRGHSGTRLISWALTKSGIYMGRTNESGDLVPAQKMYAAAKLAGEMVKRVDDMRWDISELLTSQPPILFRRCVELYTSCLNGYKIRGWKLPETVLGLPWIIKMYPEAHYIYWTRDPWDALTGGHLTDKLSSFGVQSANYPDILESRIESWSYQKQLMDETPQPEKTIHIKYEDFVLNQENELDRLSNFLGISVKAIPVVKTNIGINDDKLNRLLERRGVLR
jgi:hypothetical protein